MRIIILRNILLFLTHQSMILAIQNEITPLIIIIDNLHNALQLQQRIPITYTSHKHLGQMDRKHKMSEKNANEINTKNKTRINNEGMVDKIDKLFLSRRAII